MKKILNIVILVSSFILIGCGGGSSNISNDSNSNVDYKPELKYIGKKDKAKLNDKNSNEYIQALNSVFSNLLVGGLENSRHNRKLSKVINSNREQGSNSGYVDIKSEKIDNINYMNTLEYHNYSNDGVVILNGKVVAKLEFKPDFGDLSLKKEFLEKLKITINKESLTLDGEISFPNGYIDRIKNKTAVSNYIVKYKDKMLMYKDFSVSYEYDKPIKYSGKIYMSEYGYVDVSTLKSLKYNDYGKPLVGGQLSFNGNNSILQYKEAYDGRVRVEIDNDGDGIADEVKIYKDYNFEKEVSNSAPKLNIEFPKEIFTDTELTNTVKVYDPDLDDFNITYEWSVNGVVKSSNSVLDNNLFKKHDKIKLKVVAKDSFGNSSSKTKEQVVINSRPVITMSKKNFKLNIDETTSLGFSVVDADGDDLNISFESYESTMPDEDFINFYFESYNSCVDTLKDTYDDSDFSELTPYEQEDIINSSCPKDIDGHKVSYNFIKDNSFNAVAGGDYLHKVIVNDGEYTRELVFQSHIKQLDLVEKTINNHTELETHGAPFGSVYIDDMDGYGKKDIAYGTYVKENIDPMNEDEEDIENWVPGIAIEYRDGDKILKKVTKDIGLYDYDANINNFYVADLNGDGRKDIVVNYYDTDSFDNKKFNIFLQENDGNLSDANLKILDDARDIAVGKLYNGSDSLILSYYDSDASIFKTKIYTMDNNITLEPISNKDNIKIDKKILVSDVNSDDKNDIVLVDRSKEANSTIKLNVDIYYQANNGSFKAKRLNKTLENIDSNDSIIDAVIDNNILYVSTKKSIFVLDILDNQLTLKSRVKYNEKKSRYFMQMDKPVDINHDGLKDIIVYDQLSAKPVSIFIKKDANSYYPEEWYYPASSEADSNVISQSSCRLNDIDSNGKYEVFINTGDENLSAIYFK